MNYSDLPKWDRRFLDLAKTVGLWSKGPRKHIGAVIVRPDKSVASMGYNGPPRGFDDAAFLAMTRKEQHKVVIHAEQNALLQLHNHEKENIRDGFTDGYSIYVSPLYPCVNCAMLIVDSGIKRVVAYCGHLDATDWLESAKESEKLFKANNIDYIFVQD